MQKLVGMKGTEWMQKVLAGERDFSRVKIVGEEEVLRSMKEINEYLMLADLENNPLIFDGSDLTGIKVPGIYALHTRARGVRAPYADLTGAFLEHSDFSPYKNSGNTETRSNLAYVTLDNARMAHSDLTRARVRGMSVFNTDLSYSVIRDLQDFDRAFSVGRANFFSATMTPAEEDVIRRANAYRIQ